MGWTYKLSHKAYNSILSKRQSTVRRRDQARTEAQAHAANVDRLALDYLVDHCETLASKKLDPAKESDVHKIPSRRGPSVHIFFQEKPYTAFYTLDTVNHVATMIDFCDGDDAGAKLYLAEKPPARPTLWSRISPQNRYRIILTVSLLVSLSGLALACVFRRPDYASRAGAISTIMGNALILIRPDYGRDTYNSRMRATAGIPDAERVKTQADALAQWLSINSDGQTYQNHALVIAAIIGTIFWGFGDLLAIYIMHSRGITPLCS